MENQNELMHYGVLGMKWGIRRGMKALASSKQSGSKGEHNYAVATLTSHRDKATKKLEKLSKKGAKLEKQYTKQVEKIEPKAAKLRLKAAKHERKGAGVGIFRTDFSDAHLRKAAILNAKAAKLENTSAKVKAKLHKNQRMQEIFRQGINDINKELVKNGQDFLYMKPNGMPYTLNDYD